VADLGTHFIPEDIPEDGGPPESEAFTSAHRIYYLAPNRLRYESWVQFEGDPYPHIDELYVSVGTKTARVLYSRWITDTPTLQNLPPLLHIVDREPLGYPTPIPQMGTALHGMPYQSPSVSGFNVVDAVEREADI
jgi:hypothetical protein